MSGGEIEAVRSYSAFGAGEVAANSAWVAPMCG